MELRGGRGERAEAIAEEGGEEGRVARRGGGSGGEVAGAREEGGEASLRFREEAGASEELSRHG